MEKNIELQNVVWREGNYYVTQCLNVDVSSFGNTQPEALKNLMEAIELYLEDKDTDIGAISNPKIVKRQMAYA
jgi:predicted RNase H-like HicB family nuclease